MKNSKRLTIKDLVEDIEILKKRIADLENEVLVLKNKTSIESTKNTSQEIIVCTKCDESFKTGKELRRHEKSNHTLPQIKCNFCEKVFHKNCDLESHLNKDHKPQKFECQKCDKMFVLKWRLIKHQKIHDSLNIKKCHYFNNQKPCPFEQIGCMFLHLPAGQCKNRDSCTMKLCSFEHERIKVNHNDAVDKYSQEEEVKVTEEEQISDMSVKENFPDIFENYLQNGRTIQCYYCEFRTKSKNFSTIKEEVNKHLKLEHKEVIYTFENEELVIENLLHAEFIELFASD